MKKGKRVERIEAKVEGINTLLKMTDHLGIEPDSTWESVYRFEPLRLNKYSVTIKYVEVYGNKTPRTEVYFFTHEDFDRQLNWVLRCVKKQLNFDNKNQEN